MTPKSHVVTWSTLSFVALARPKSKTFEGFLVDEGFHSLGRPTVTSLVEGLGIPKYMDGRGHKARLNWPFDPVGRKTKHGSEKCGLCEPCFSVFHTGIPVRDIQVRLEPIDPHTYTGTGTDTQTDRHIPPLRFTSFPVHHSSRSHLHPRTRLSYSFTRWK
jgi:hypothetical protein